MLTQLGASYLAEECLGECITILSTNDISKKSNAGCWRLLNINRDGAVFRVDLSISPIKDQAGTIVGLLVAVRPVRNTNYSDERIQGLIQTIQNALSRQLKKLLETVLMEEDSVAESPRPKRDKKQSNGNGGNADLIPGNGQLTQRELENFTLIGRGLSTRKIATKLDVSAYTVQTHRNHIQDKLNLPDFSAITYWAFQWVHHKV